MNNAGFVKVIFMTFFSFASSFVVSKQDPAAIRPPYENFNPVDFPRMRGAQGQGIVSIFVENHRLPLQVATNISVLELQNRLAHVVPVRQQILLFAGTYLHSAPNRLLNSFAGIRNGSRIDVLVAR